VPQSQASPAVAGSLNNAGEEVATAYRREDGTPDIAAIARLQRLFRDIRQDSPGPMPPLLIDLLSILQEVWGFERPLTVISGYRTPATNAAIEGAAPASLHLDGLAADITVRGVHPLDVALAAHDLSQRLNFMGLGLYPRFVHLDIGPRRTWTRLGPR
jgi:uncharacterized protein YcbK (DUF882 family)